MKKVLNFLLIVIFISSSAMVQGQQAKFGHIEAQQIVLLMPEYKKAADSLNVVKEKYDLQAEKMQVEVNKKYNDLLENQNKLDSLILESMYSELQSMNERLQSFQGQANQKLRALEGALLEGVMAKLQKQISVVAKELDLMYVFDISARNPVYVSEKSINIGPMVKEKLAIK